MKYKFYSDRAHGWLAVKTVELLKLDILHKISRFSYISDSNKTVYLEEDCDINIFTAAAGITNNDIIEINCMGRSKIRDLKPFELIRKPPK